MFAGWLVLAAMLFMFASLLALFPKTLPRAAARKKLATEKKACEGCNKTGEQEMPASLEGKHIILSYFFYLICY